MSSISISIHALLAESDDTIAKGWDRLCNFYPRSPCGERLLHFPTPFWVYCISIHALLAESDTSRLNAPSGATLFLSTLSLRRATKQLFATVGTTIFLSTLSLRRATPATNWNNKNNVISIHALLAESDTGGQSCNSTLVHFYPRSPCGERPSASGTLSDTSDVFLSTLSLRRATRCELGRNNRKVISIHALLAESD